MKAEILARLNEINEEFYQKFSHSFSQTRLRIQQGVRGILQTIPSDGKFLDIGCGNGNLASAWVEQGFRGSFIGVDFSPGLIASAKTNASTFNTDQRIEFLQVDLSHDDWISHLPDEAWNTIFCFAVMHHIPAASRRLRLCKQIKSLLSPGTGMWLSVWQPLNSPRLKKRIYKWEIVGVDADQVEEGDVLMDWRAHQQTDSLPAYRYVHIFTEKELSEQAQLAGFHVNRSFYSDGKEGNLALYQHWMVDN